MSPVPDDFGPPELIPELPSAARYRRYDELAKLGELEGQQMVAKPTGKAESFLSKAAESVPIIGAPYNKAVAALESISPFFSSRHLERGEGDYQPKTADEALAAQHALMGQRAEEHPGMTTAGEIAGNVAGYGVLPTSAMASLPAAMATTGGISALDRTARGGTGKEVAGAGIGGALGGAAGYGGAKVLSKALGKLADWQAIRAMGGTTAPAFRDIANVSGNLGLETGGIAALGRGQGIVGGLKKLPDVAEAAGAAREQVGEQFGNLIRKADEGGSLIPIDEAISAISSTGKKNIRPKYLEAATKEAADELKEVAGPSGLLTHTQLQDWLSGRAEQASGIASAVAKKENVSAGDRAFSAVYRAGRDLQDKYLGQAVQGGGDAKELRRLLALNAVTERVAQNRGQMLAAQHPIGLIGSMGALSGLHQITQGNLGTGIPLLALSLAGKATGPYRANVLTSLFSGGQGALQRAGEAGIPAVLGSKAGAALGGYLGAPSEDDFGPPEPAGPGPALVAKRGK